jgi:hypothetical protein
MNPDVLAAIISAASSAAVAITALLLNQRGFTTIENRINGLAQDIRDLRAENSAIRGDLKGFYTLLAEHDKRLGRIEDKLNIPPR